MFGATVLIFILGAIVGSFLNVIILRMPKDESIGGHSHCPNCRHELKAFDLFPIFSFFFLRGKCRYCRKGISARYIAIETITGLLFAIAFLIFQPVTSIDAFFFFRVLFIISVMIAIFVIDLENFLILDALLFPAIIILLFFNLGADILSVGTITTSWTFLGIAAAVGISAFFYILHWISKGKWIGLGDVKFGVFLGLATPGMLAFVTVLLAYAIGAVIGIFLIGLAGKKLTSRVPFGTFLAMASVITIFQGQEILRWYLHLIGVRF